MDLSLLGKEPVQGDRPAGSDIRYDPGFEELQAEVDKLSTPSASGSLDWKKVERLASEILAQKSKDLLVASYLAVALIYTRKIEGFAIGLRVYQDLLELYWESLYPPVTRMRGRLGAITWWLEKSETALEQCDQDRLPPDQLNQFKEILEKIDRSLANHLEEAPSLRPILQWVDSRTPLSPEEEKSPLTTESPKLPEKRGIESFQELSSPEDAQKILSAWHQKVREVAEYLRKVDSSNPQSYRLTRWISWSAINDLPQASQGRTQIPPPAVQIKAPLEELREKKNHEALLRLAETTFPQYIFWFDLNRWEADALTSLGATYRRAHDVVCQETAFLVYRLPGLEDLSFSDGTPFADQETKEWLKRISLATGSFRVEAFPVAEPGGSNDDEDSIHKVAERGEILIRQGKLADAVRPFQQRVQSAFSQKEKLFWRMAMSRLLLNANQAKLAIPHLEQILKDIDDFRLEEYDPMIALQGLKLAWEGFDAQSEKSFKERAAQTLHRIGKIDLEEVIRLGKGK